MRKSLFKFGFLLISLGINCFTSLYAQNICGTDHIHQQYLDSEPGALATEMALEAIYQKRVLEGASTLQKTAEDPRPKYIIPCVVHVIHNGGSENISDAQVISQFKRMNEDFRRKPETKGFGAGVDYQVEFELATKDPSGNATNGIVRINSTLTNHNMDTEQTTLKNLSKWPQNRYLNIWIVKQTSSGSQAGVLAYATFPQNGGNTNDGVVCSHYCWGTTGTAQSGRDMGRVGVHEIGHWLNLYHTFQGSGTSGCSGLPTLVCTSQGDRVCDTPPSDVALFTNPSRVNSCTEPNDRPSRSRNYMDYADDGFKDEFSAGQRVRSQTALDNDISRSNMWQLTNLQSTGVGPYLIPEADFIAENRFPCVNSPVRFTDWSTRRPTSWSWSFQGGTPATSNLQDPTVTYAAPGTYNVTLTVTNLTGSSTAFTKTGYIVVTNTTVNFPYSEDFEGSVFPPAGCRIENPNGDFNTFQSSSSVSAFGNGSKSMRMGFYTYRMYDFTDAFITPSINLSSAVLPQVYFAGAHARYSKVYSDTLRVWASSDCGNSWVQIFKAGGADLATKSDSLTASSFQPSTSEWINFAADLSGFAGQSNVQIKFETQNGYGNNLFLDNLQVREAWATQTEAERLASLQVNVYPNPFQQSFTFEVNNGPESIANISILDVQGREVYHSTPFQLTAGKYKTEIQPATPLAPGVYQLLFKVEGSVTQVTRIVQQ
ncbi:MAG: PKD domain-containing protein [Sphingobacteriia bacterium]|nr:PKD domain-containing protein [Sphingobacteriia bacterium]